MILAINVTILFQGYMTSEWRLYNILWEQIILYSVYLHVLCDTENDYITIIFLAELLTDAESIIHWQLKGFMIQNFLKS